MIQGRPVESDSDDSSDQDTQVEIANYPRNRPSENNEERTCCKLCIGAIICVIIICLIVFESNSIDPPQSLSVQIDINNNQIVNSLTKVTQIVNQSKHNITNLPSEYPPPLLIINLNKTLTLPFLQQAKSFGNSNFLWANLRKGTMHWYTPHEITCEPDMIINSASKIADNLYIQKTVYSQTSIIYHKVTIPAADIYSLQPVRQFIANLTSNPQNVIAYCHNSPLLLVLAASFTESGIFVSNSTDWQLFQHNLVLNDLFPLAQPYPKQQILTSKGYNILISNDPTIIKSLLFEQKRDLVLIMDINSPFTLQTYVILRLKVYRFVGEGEECEAFKIQLHEQLAWHIQSNATLMPNWYALTTESFPLPITYKKKQYQTPLYSPRKIKCIKLSSFQPVTQVFNTNYTLTSVPYQGMHLFKHVNDTVIDHHHYQEIILYFQQNSIKKIVYFHSGSYYLMLLLISTLSNDTKVIINPNYTHYRILKKNLVLNNLQITFHHDLSEEISQPQLIIASSLDSVMHLNPHSILLDLTQPQTINSPSYSINTFQWLQQCIKSDLIPFTMPTLPIGTYMLIEKA